MRPRGAFVTENVRQTTKRTRLKKKSRTNPWSDRNLAQTVFPRSQRCLRPMGKNGVSNLFWLPSNQRPCMDCLKRGCKPKQLPCLEALSLPFKRCSFMFLLEKSTRCICLHPRYLPTDVKIQSHARLDRYIYIYLIDISQYIIYVYISLIPSTYQ